MGGVNHQPCRQYLKNSTMMSRSMSSAKSHLEQANIALEDVLLAELDDQSKPLSPMIDALKHSTTSLKDALEICDLLECQMDNEGYQDLPPFHSLDLNRLGSSMSVGGLVDEGAWNDVQEWGSTGGFYAVLRQFKIHFSELLELTEKLIQKVSTLAIDAPTYGISSALEENLPQNLKVEFAQLYAKWHWFQARFLASSMLSTEVWYAFNDYGSLTQHPFTRKAVA